MTNFSGLGLIEPLLRAVAAEGYEAPTPIQAQSIPHLLEGRDLLGVAQTGTGKTAAFVLPLLNDLASAEGRPGPREVFSLVLAPTRELAIQIHDSVRTYGRFLRLRSAAVFGGAPIGKQIKAAATGLDVLVATPGRLKDLLDRKALRLDRVETFILDEADRMLDLGFINDVRKIAALLPRERQTVLFSATMPQAVAKLAASLLNNPERVEVAPQATTAERIEQRVLFVQRDKKRNLLSRLLADDAGIQRVLIFTRTKHGADKVARWLDNDGVSVDAIHGNKAQNARQRALDGFRSGRLRALVATDIAARGIDVDGVTHVINFDLPNDPESYVHRIGRTARAGAAGMAISFCDAEERPYLRDIEKIIRQAVPVHTDHPFHDDSGAGGHLKAAKGAGGRHMPAPPRGGDRNRGRPGNNNRRRQAA
ncbi:MAG: DEAD/DEAH box helicase [Magnetospirillum sp. WYHS-4]